MKLPWSTQLKRGNEADPLVDYVLLAEFDIDTGSTLRHQYPAAVPNYAADFFAELMLPEGVHNREIDYTYIFLNRTQPHIDQHLWVHPHQRKPEQPTVDKSNSGEVALTENTDSASKKLSFLYGINMVKTKHDSSVRRGAVVKAMCIFSRYQFVESFKRPLELALDEYYRTQSAEVLKNLFEALNDVDISSLPRPNFMEQSLMRRGITYNPITATQPVDHLPSSWEGTVHFNFIKFAEEDKGSSTSASNLEGGESSEPVAAGNTAENSDESKPKPLATLRSSFCKSRAFKEIPLKIPLYCTPDEVGTCYITLLVKTFGESCMRIFNSILMKKRVLFVGYNHAASEVAQMVLSAVAMVSPPLTGIIRRTYPYANLSDLSFLEVPGYVAGVTNPMFQQRDSWWDLLCVLDLPNGTGQIISSEDKNQASSASSSSAGSSSSSSSGGSAGVPAAVAAAPGDVTGRLTPTTHTMHAGNSSKNASRTNLAAAAVLNYDDTPYYSADVKFVFGVISGINALIGEDWVRQQFYDYAQSIIQGVYDTGATLDVKRLSSRSMKALETNLPRIRALEGSSDLIDMPSHPWLWCNNQSTAAVKASTTAAQSVETSDAPSKTIPQTSTSTTNNNNAAVDPAAADPAAVTMDTVVEGGVASPVKIDTTAAAADSSGVTVETMANLLSHSGSSKHSSKRSNKLRSRSMESVARLLAPGVSNIGEDDASLGDKSDKEEGDNDSDNDSDNDDNDDDNDDDDDEDDDDDVSVASSTVSFADQNTLGLLIRAYLRKLQHEANMDSKNDAQLCFQLMEHYLRSEQALQALLVLLPESTGGLQPIALGLFNENPNVRYSAGMILQRVLLYPSTQAAFQTLSGIYRSAYERQMGKIAGGEYRIEIQQYRRFSKSQPKLPLSADKQSRVTATASSSLPTGTGIAAAGGGAGRDYESGIAARNTTHSSSNQTVGQVMANSSGDVVQDVMDGANVVIGSLLQSTFAFINAEAAAAAANAENDNGGPNSSSEGQGIDAVDLFP